MSQIIAVIVFVLMAIVIVGAKLFNLKDSLGTFLHKPRSKRDDAE